MKICVKSNLLFVTFAMYV